MKRENVFKVVKKELRSYLNSPAYYIVAMVFLLLWEFLFFRSAFLVGEASLRGMYSLFPWLMLILVPAVTMATIAKEREDSTMEWVLTQPISDLEFVSGKFLGSVAFLSLTLVFILPLAISFSIFGDFDWGIFAGQLLGSIFFAAAFSSLGIFISSVITSQIAALLVSAGAGFILVISGMEFFTMSLPRTVATISERLSLNAHMGSIARGVLDTRDVWYFLSFITVFICLTYLQMLKARFGNRKSMYRSFQFGVALLVGIAILTNIIGSRFSRRLDLTQGKIYTLSGSTKNILSNLDDLVTITFYASDKLPVQYSSIIRETKDTLRDYRSASNNKLNYTIKDPSSSPEVKNEANTLGVSEVQFNVVGQEEFQVKTGYIGLVISYAGRQEIIPFVQDSSDLEYQLTSLIKKLTVEEKKSIAFLSGHGEKDFSRDYNFVSQELSSQFIISPLVLEPSEATDDVFGEAPSPVEISPVETPGTISPIRPDLDVLVVAGPNLVMGNGVKDAIDTYVNQGGNVVFLLDSYNVSMQYQSVNQNANNIADVVAKYGVIANTNVLYDLRLSETVRFSDNVMSYLLPYPYWLRALPLDEQNSITLKIRSVTLPWVASLDINEEALNSAGYVATPLLHTTPFAGANTENVSLDPTQKFNSETLGEMDVALLLTPQQEDSAQGNIVVIGDSDFLTDQFVQSNPENLVFGMNLLSWLAEEDSLGDIRIKGQSNGLLLFNKESQPMYIKVVTMTFVVLVPSIFGGLRLRKRRNLAKKRYEV
jgi:ABC-type uncharacterized transport system involved in gliding motility auxiliary subunit/ABC-type transport system involved in multi-copper enzyme maturation permease subunit